MAWQPSASIEVVRARAALYNTIREFFSVRDVLEVDVPVLSPYATSDPYIQSFVVDNQQYLQTSPEFFLKRFLAAYQQDCFYLGKAFRKEERGARHATEFTMLEWYRINWQEDMLLNEVVHLIEHVLGAGSCAHYHYRDIFFTYTGINPLSTSVQELKDFALAEGARTARNNSEVGFDSADKNTWLDYIFTCYVEPQLPQGLVVIDAYPASQAALARVTQNHNNELIARRFEVYYNGIELANGYWELTDGEEQRFRFEQDQLKRKQQQLPVYPYDTAVVQALESDGFPPCAGVALGVDRLLMCQQKQNTLQQVLTFT